MKFLRCIILFSANYAIVFPRKFFCMNCRKALRMILLHDNPGHPLEVGLICGLIVGLDVCVKFS